MALQGRRRSDTTATQKPEGVLRPINNTIQLELKENQQLPRDKALTLIRAAKLVDPSTSLGQIVECAAEPDLPALPEEAQTNPCDQLHALIQAGRSPHGQRTLFAAIDALRPELKYEDIIAGLQTALSLQRETLEDALENPSMIQGRCHVREKLEAEYHALPDEEVLNGIVMDALIQGIKERLGSRWRVEAMSARQLKGAVQIGGLGGGGREARW